MKELKLLLVRNMDGAAGYKFASDHISNKNFKNFLKTYSEQRQKYADELKKILESKGESADQNTSILGDIHQAFIKLKDSVSEMSDSSILKECERGEDQALSDYESSIRANIFSPDVQRVVIMQRDKIMAARNTMRELLLVVED